MKVVLGSIMLLGLASAVADSTISCYEGTSTGDVFNSTGGITVEESQTACSVKTVEGVKGSTHDGLIGTNTAKCTETITKTCTGSGWSKCASVTEKECICITNLCNNAPPATTAAALMVIIPMALIAKFI